jgi:hypothetical protein
LKPSQVKKIIELTANTAIPPAGLPWPNPVYENGIGNAHAAVDLVLDGLIPPA